MRRKCDLAMLRGFKGEQKETKEDTLDTDREIQGETNGTKERH